MNSDNFVECRCCVNKICLLNIFVLGLVAGPLGGYVGYKHIFVDIVFIRNALGQEQNGHPLRWST